MELGDRLKEARNDAGLTGEKLGKMLGVSKQTIAHWEANRYEPKLTHLAKLSDVLGVSVDWLVTGRSVEQLSPAAIKQGRFYEALSPEARRKWETAKSLIQGSAPPPDMGVGVKSREIPVGVQQHEYTIITNDKKHIELSIPGTAKNIGGTGDQSSSDPEPESPERGKHAASTPTTRRGR